MTAFRFLLKVWKSYTYVILCKSGRYIKINMLNKQNFLNVGIPKSIFIYALLKIRNKFLFSINKVFKLYVKNCFLLPNFSTLEDFPKSN